jgi:peptidoglycan/LPS O-acetylase OafA/YrhL
VTTALERPVVVADTRAWHRPDIEGLRAVAVLLVVLYHCGVTGLGGGYVGVDVFFVISGFLITSLLLREAAATGRISIVAFYARRARRLLPAATLVTAVTVLAGWRWLPPLRAPHLALDGLATTVYGLNYRLAAAGADYLNADAAVSPLQHFWSLAVEEQFYLVWPLLLLACRRMRRTALSVVVAGSLAISVWQTWANPTWAYFGLHARAWELGAGALVAVLGVRLPRVAAPAGLAAIALAAVLFTDRTAFPGYAALLPVAGTVAVLMARSRLLAAAPLQVIGRLSYSWYLWHWPFLVLGPVALGVAPGLVVNLALAVGALLAAALTYATLENPVRRLRFPARRTLACALAVTVLAAAAYLVAGRAATRPASAYTAPVLTSLRPADLGRLAPAVPRNLRPSLRKSAADQPRLYRDKCSSQFTDATIRMPCAYGDLASPTTIVLFGDSHAGAWFPALEAIAVQRHWKLVVVTKSACSAASVRTFQLTLNRPFDECVRWRESAWAYLRALDPAMIVVASAAAGGSLVEKATDLDATWTAAWARSADLLVGTGARLYLIDDTPYQRSDVPDCLSAHPDAPAACTVDRGSALPHVARRRMIDATLRRRGFTTIDPTPWFCTSTRCPVIVGDVLVYRDISHVTATYARLLAPLLSPHLPP